LDEMVVTIAPVDLRPLTQQLGGRLDYGQPVGSEPPTREPDRFSGFTRWKRCASGTPQTGTMVQVHGDVLLRTSQRPHPPGSISEEARDVKQHQMPAFAHRWVHNNTLKRIQQLPSSLRRCSRRMAPPPAYSAQEARPAMDTNLILLIIAAVLSLPGGLFMASIMS
jgi:hypothetical protein